MADRKPMEFGWPMYYLPQRDGAPLIDGDGDMWVWVSSAKLKAFCTIHPELCGDARAVAIPNAEALLAFLKEWNKFGMISAIVIDAERSDQVYYDRMSIDNVIQSLETGEPH